MLSHWNKATVHAIDWGPHPVPPFQETWAESPSTRAPCVLWSHLSLAARRIPGGRKKQITLPAICRATQNLDWMLSPFQESMTNSKQQTTNNKTKQTTNDQTTNDKQQQQQLKQQQQQQQQQRHQQQHQTIPSHHVLSDAQNRNHERYLHVWL